MANTISNTDNVIDSRDVIARIEELEDEIAAHENELCEELTNDGATEEQARAAIASKIGGPDDAVYEERAELSMLQGLQSDCEGYSDDWRYGATLIRDSYFKDYAMELAEDIGAIDKAASWPNTCIDWEQAAHELQMDYMAVEFGDVTYWVR